MPYARAGLAPKGKDTVSTAGPNMSGNNFIGTTLGDLTLSPRPSATMRGMIHFRITKLFLVVACFAVACGGYLTWDQLYWFGHQNIITALCWLVIDSPLWMPFAFLAYVVGSRKVTLWMILVFAALEIAALAIGHATTDYLATNMRS
jgi:hypothetical protein